MGQDRVGTPDLKPDSVGSAQIINGSILINDLKINGSVDSITAQTIPYEPTAFTPTIWDKIDSIQSGITLITDNLTTSGTTTDYTLSQTLNPAVISWVVLNGQPQIPTTDYSFATGNTVLRFTYTPEVGLKIQVFYQKV